MRKSAINLQRRNFFGSAMMAAASFACAPFAVARDKGGEDLQSVQRQVACWMDHCGKQRRHVFRIRHHRPARPGEIDFRFIESGGRLYRRRTRSIGKASLSEYASSGAEDEKSIRSALAKNLNKIVSGPLVYDSGRFHGVRLSSKTRSLLNSDPQGKDLIKLNRMLFADALPMELRQLTAGWIVKNGVMSSTGAGRGVTYTARDYGRFRWMFTMRHVSGDPDHQACVLVFCTRPEHDQAPLDALGGIQFQVPKGGHWDYRTGHNNAGGVEFVEMKKPGFDPHQWSRVEIVADAVTGAVRMAVAQPVGSKAVEVLEFHDPIAGKPGPIALQMHNGGLFDEYKDMTIEENPPTLDLTTTA